MVANVFGSRFYSFREPAWHKLGMVLDEQKSANEALSLVGTYDVWLEDLVSSSGLKLDDKVIVRGPTNDDPEKRVFGIVGNHYTLITPVQVANVWDKAVAKPVETLGSLGHGETIFITTKMNSVSIKGDEVVNYLLVTSPMTGGDAAQVLVTPIRVVCQNTLIAAKSDASETYRIIHDRYAMQRMENWLDGVYNRAMEKAVVLEQAFNAMAGYIPTAEQIDSVIGVSYPFPKMPRNNVPDDVKKTRQVVWEKLREKVLARRLAVKELYEGKAIGADSTAFKGTLWGLYNSVTEVENYRRTRGQDAAPFNTLFGDRAKVMSSAYNAVLEMSKN